MNPPAMSPVESTLTIAGTQVLLRQSGQGAPLLWLHGEQGGGFTPALTRLARRFTVLAPDLPGFGHSETPEWFDNIHDLGFFTLELLHALNLSGVHLLGTSLGGWVAAEAAVRDCSRLASLTLSNAMGVQVKGQTTLDPFLATPEEEIRARFHNQSLAEAAMAAPEDAAETDRQLKNRFGFARLAWAPRLHDPHLEKWLHRIRRPTLVLNGAHDSIVPPATGACYAALIPGARHITLPATAHQPEVEQPDAFCAHVEQFIAEHAP